MKKLKVLVLLIIFLISGVSLANDNDDQIMVINLKAGDAGEDLICSKLNWPDWIDQQIALVNSGQGEFFVEISNDPTEWQLVNWLELQTDLGLEELIDQGVVNGALVETRSIIKPFVDEKSFKRLNYTLDAGLNLARMQNVVSLLQDKGLTKLALRHIPLRSDRVWIKIYYQSYPVKETVISQSIPYRSKETDEAVEESLARLYELVRIKAEEMKSSNWGLTLGLEATAVSDGQPIIVPTASIVRLKGKTMLVATGGFWSKGDFDHKHASLWLAHFPKSPSLGFVLQASYASQTFSDGNGYVQQGYGPMAGLILRDDKLSVHLTGGFQYFDRLNQDRRLEPAVNLGVNLGIFSF